MSEDAELKIGEFMRAAGLFCGSLDLVVDKDGTYWFLECNGEGAWGWLDLRSDGEVRRLFAEKIFNRLQ